MTCVCLPACNHFILKSPCHRPHLRSEGFNSGGLGATLCRPQWREKRKYLHTVELSVTDQNREHFFFFFEAVGVLCHIFGSFSRHGCRFLVVAVFHSWRRFFHSTHGASSRSCWTDQLGLFVLSRFFRFEESLTRTRRLTTANVEEPKSDLKKKINSAFDSFAFTHLRRVSSFPQQHAGLPVLPRPNLRPFLRLACLHGTWVA